MLNLLFMPLGAGCLLVLWVSGGGWALWGAAGSFWVYCVLNQQIENMGERAPDHTAALQLASLGVTAVLGAFGLIRWLIG